MKQELPCAAGEWFEIPLARQNILEGFLNVSFSSPAVSLGCSRAIPGLFLVHFFAKVLCAARVERAAPIEGQ